ncbi:eukaryotic translation initiation factor 4 gamma [Anaeramoeba flamelloides]|uniref:Eukaryotic translation initiation factor 4 gamma n=1 Tax=Anaeramoeba flamelloides TaxID=1746091 RepID=A0ABQ8XF08_9EUKA|nr:eukaryotic translation initiation factor 4 gamma [Anaeramoeba flamelloides]
MLSSSSESEWSLTVTPSPPHSTTTTPSSSPSSSSSFSYLPSPPTLNDEEKQAFLDSETESCKQHYLVKLKERQKQKKAILTKKEKIELRSYCKIKINLQLNDLILKCSPHELKLLDICGNTKLSEISKELERNKKYLKAIKTQKNRDKRTNVLEFKRGTIVELLEKTNEDWWKGKYKDKIGYFLVKNIEEIKNKETVENEGTNKNNLFDEKRNEIKIEKDIKIENDKKNKRKEIKKEQEKGKEIKKEPEKGKEIKKEKEKENENENAKEKEKGIEIQLQTFFKLIKGNEIKEEKEISKIKIEKEKDNEIKKETRNKLKSKIENEEEIKIKKEILNLSLLILCNSPYISKKSIQILLHNGADPCFQKYNENNSSTFMALCLNPNITVELFKIILQSILNTQKEKEKEEEEEREKGKGKGKGNEKENQISNRKDMEKEIEKDNYLLQFKKDQNNFNFLHYLLKNSNIQDHYNFCEILKTYLSKKIINHIYDSNTIKIYCLNSQAYLKLINKIFKNCSNNSSSLKLYNDKTDELIHHKYFLFLNKKAFSRLFPTLNFDKYIKKFKKEKKKFNFHFFFKLCSDPKLTPEYYEIFLTHFKFQYNDICPGLHLNCMFSFDIITLEHLKVAYSIFGDTMGYFLFNCYEHEECGFSFLNKSKIDSEIMQFLIDCYHPSYEYCTMQEYNYFYIFIKFACQKFQNRKFVEQIIKKIPLNFDFQFEDNELCKQFQNVDEYFLKIFNKILKYLDFHTIQDCKLFYKLIKKIKQDKNYKFNDKNEQKLLDFVKMKCDQKKTEISQKDLILEILEIDLNFDKSFENDFKNYYKNAKFTNNNFTIDNIPVHKEIIEIRTGMEFKNIKQKIENLKIPNKELKFFLKCCYSIKNLNYNVKKNEKKNSSNNNNNDDDDKNNRLKKIINKFRKILQITKLNSLKESIKELWFEDEDKQEEQEKEEKGNEIKIEKDIKIENYKKNKRIEIKKEQEIGKEIKKEKEKENENENAKKKEKEKKKKKEKNKKKIINNHKIPKDFIIITTNNKKQKKSIKVHKFILQARCKTYYDMFITLKNETIKERKDYSKISYKSLFYFIKFLYFNKLNKEDFKDINNDQNKEKIIEEIIYSIDHFGLNPKCGLKYILLFDTNK